MEIDNFCIFIFHLKPNTQLCIIRQYTIYISHDKSFHLSFNCVPFDVPCGVPCNLIWLRLDDNNLGDAYLPCYSQIMDLEDDLLQLKEDMIKERAEIRAEKGRLRTAIVSAQCHVHYLALIVGHWLPVFVRYNMLLVGL